MYRKQARKLSTLNAKNTALNILAGLGLGVAGATLAIAVKWYCEVMIPIVRSGYAKAWEIDRTWLWEFLVVMAASVIMSTICFRKLHTVEMQSGKNGSHRRTMCCC